MEADLHAIQIEKIYNKIKKKKKNFKKKKNIRYKPFFFMIISNMTHVQQLMTDEQK